MRAILQRNDSCHSCPLAVYKLDQDYWGKCQRNKLSGPVQTAWEGLAWGVGSGTLCYNLVTCKLINTTKIQWTLSHEVLVFQNHSLGLNRPLKLTVLTGLRSIFCCATFYEQMKCHLDLKFFGGVFSVCVSVILILNMILLRLWELNFLQVNYCPVWEDVREKSSTTDIDSLWEKYECSLGRAICSEQLSGQKSSSKWWEH